MRLSLTLSCIASITASLATGFAPCKAVEKNHANSQRLAVLAPLAWEMDSLENGAAAFLDADFTFEETPPALQGLTFLRSNFLGTRKVCINPGMVYAITPEKENSRYSRAGELESLGFQLQEQIAPFAAFGDQWKGLNCRVYAKHVECDERIDLHSSTVVLKSHPGPDDQGQPPANKGKWCVLIASAPAPQGNVGDVVRRHSTFDPPLAQRYTVAAQVPSLEYFIHDPAVIRLPDGDFLAFSPCWKRPAGVGKKEGAYVMVTKSEDAGRTWTRLPDLPYAEATPFLAQGKLFLFTQPRQHQDVYFMRSDDGGGSWTGPVKVIEGPYWNCQTNFVEKDGFLYWVLDKQHQGTVAIAGDLSQDLLTPEAWRASNVLEPVMTPPELRPSGTDLYSAGEPAKFRDWNLEGNVMLVGDRLRIAARVNPNPGGTPGLAAVFDLVDENGQLKLSYDQHYPWPGGQTKFSILHDPKTRLFWMACNVAAGPVDPGTAADRRYLMLYFGHDGMNWLPAGCIAFAPAPSQSFMYPSMQIDGDDLVILSRTGREFGHFHDADMSTFHRVKDFRSLAWY